jgi:hypothetical protein
MPAEQSEADMRPRIVDLLLVELQREPQLLDRFVGCRERIRAVSAEIMARMLEIILGAFERGDCLPYLRMALTTGSSAFLHRSSCLLPCGDGLSSRDG